MNPAQVDFLADQAASLVRDDSRTQNEIVRDYLLAHPNEWVAMPILAKLITKTGIGAAVHSRIANCRGIYGMTITNRVTRSGGVSEEFGTNTMQPSLTLKPESIAEIIQLPSGALIIRARPGRKLKLTNFAKTASQADGAYLLTPLDQRIEMTEAMEILGVPYTTLRRFVELGVVTAFKRSPGRWVLDLASVLDHKTKAENDPEYWDNLKGGETTFQTDLKL